MEIAGTKLTNNLNPLVATIYLPKEWLGELAQAIKLKKAKGGAIDKEQVGAMARDLVLVYGFGAGIERGTISKKYIE